jgi:hypothetical protein
LRRAVSAIDRGRECGVDHVDFKLSAGGDAIVLYDATGGN